MLHLCHSFKIALKWLLYPPICISIFKAYTRLIHTSFWWKCTFIYFFMCVCCGFLCLHYQLVARNSTSLYSLTRVWHNLLVTGVKKTSNNYAGSLLFRKRSLCYVSKDVKQLNFKHYDTQYFLCILVKLQKLWRFF